MRGIEIPLIVFNQKKKNSSPDKLFTAYPELVSVTFVILNKNLIDYQRSKQGQEPGTGIQYASPLMVVLLPWRLSNHRVSESMPSLPVIHSVRCLKGRRG